MKLPPCSYHHHPFIITIFISRSCSSSSQSLPHHQLCMDQPETSITIIIIFVIISGQKKVFVIIIKSASLSASTSVQPQNSIATLLEPLQSHNALRPEPHSASAPCAVSVGGSFLVSFLGGGPRLRHCCWEEQLCQSRSKRYAERHPNICVRAEGVRRTTRGCSQVFRANRLQRYRPNEPAKTMHRNRCCE